MRQWKSFSVLSIWSFSLFLLQTTPKIWTVIIFIFVFCFFFLFKAQFGLVMLYMLYVSFKCNLNMRLVTWILCLDVAFVILFLDFYWKAYKKKQNIRGMKRWNSAELLKWRDKTFRSTPRPLVKCWFETWNTPKEFSLFYFPDCNRQRLNILSSFNFQTLQAKKSRCQTEKFITKQTVKLKWKLTKQADTSSTK